MVPSLARVRRSLALTASTALALGACRAPEAAPEATAEVRSRELHALVEAHDWFALREVLEEGAALAPAERAYFEARRDAVFNDCARSSERAHDALADGTLAGEQVLALRRLLPFNAMRLARWDEALEAAEELLAVHAGELAPRDLDDTRNLRSIFAALAGTPPRTAEVGADFVVEPDAGGRIPLELDGHPVAFTVDTGANFSVAMRSVAEAAGLELRPAGIQVGTSTGGTVEADLAVAAEVRIGDAVLEHVPFLVFPDELLTFPGLTIPGLIGFGELEALGELRFLTGGAIGVTAEPAPRAMGNLALEGLDPIVRFECLGAPAIARLDTGANVSNFYEPFLRRHRAEIEARGREEVDHTGGVGSVVELPTWRVPSLELHVGGQRVVLEEVDVYRDPLPRADRGRLDANLGRDLVDRFDEVVLDFRSMSFELRSAD